MATMSTLGYYRTSVGKKAVMAVTGLLLVVFVVFHLLGNLQIFGGPRQINAYGAFLRSIPGPLWVARSAFLAAALLHIFTGLLLVVQGLRARPRRYARRVYQEATLSSRTMLVTGPLILAYVIYHLLDQTFGTILPGFEREDIYANLTRAFSSTPHAVLYIAALLLLLLHLRHGVWSMFQSAGFNSPSYDRGLRVIGVAIAFAVGAGYILIPVAVLAGVLR